MFQPLNRSTKLTENILIVVSNLANFYLPTVFRVKSNINGEKGYNAVNQNLNSKDELGFIGSNL